MSQIGRGYPSDLSDEQWKLIQNFIPKASAGGRPRTTDVRAVLNAIFYLNRSGCAWRYLPLGFPPWSTVYMYYLHWKDQGILKKIHDFLVQQVRVQIHRDPSPSALIVDCQSIKAHWGEHRGYDGFKKVQGRKRTLFVDTLGFIQEISVRAANQGDHRLALELLDPKSSYFSSFLKRNLKAFYADSGYRASFFQTAIQERFGVWPTLKTSKVETKCIQVEPKRWDYKDFVTQTNLKPVRWRVERTFAWFNYYRRLNRDHERTVSSSETMILVAMSQLMLRRLFRLPHSYKRWN